MFESPTASTQLLGNKSETDGLNTPQNEGQEALISAPPTKSRSRWYRRKRVIAAILLVAIIIIFLAVFLPVFFVVVRKHDGKSVPGASAVGGGNIPNPNSPTGAIVSSSILRSVDSVLNSLFLSIDGR